MMILIHATTYRPVMKFFSEKIVILKILKMPKIHNCVHVNIEHDFVNVLENLKLRLFRADHFS